MESSKESGLLPTNRGLLAFLYDVYTNPSKAKAFKANPDEFMKTYELSEDQERAVWSTGLDPKVPANKVFWSTYATREARTSDAWKKSASSETRQSGPEPKITDRAKADPFSMGSLCALLVEELCKEPAFGTAW